MPFSVFQLKKIIAGGSMLLILLFFSNKIQAYDFIDWYHGSLDYDLIIEDLIDEEKPLILYFHTDWGKWSKKMDNDYLASYEVELFLSDLEKIEVNPDGGKADKALCDKYGVTEFPSLLVSIPSLNEKAHSVYPFYKGTDLSIDKFIAIIKEKIVTQYNKKGETLYKKKQYEEAIKYYEMTIEFDSENVYAFYGKGVAFHALGNEKQDVDLLEKAEKNYRSALQIDRNHQQSKLELNKVLKAISALSNQ